MVVVFVAQQECFVCAIAIANATRFRARTRARCVYAIPCVRVRVCVACAVLDILVAIDDNVQFLAPHKPIERSER